MTAISIRPLAAEDRAAWTALWAAYLSFYETEVSEEIYAVYFARLLGDDPQDYHCLLAIADGQAIGLAHFVFHRHGWSIENCCYLQDLYVADTARSKGAGQALIEAVYAAADAQGVHDVYWTTQENNVTARRLYDRIGQKTPFIKYKRL